MPRASRLLSLAALTTIVAAAHSCATTGSGPAPTLSQIVGAYHRESAPYFPVTASEARSRRHDRVLANDS
jgi:hypothetical protein